MLKYCIEANLVLVGFLLGITFVVSIFHFWHIQENILVLLVVFSHCGDSCVKGKPRHVRLQSNDPSQLWSVNLVSLLVSCRCSVSAGLWRASFCGHYLLFIYVPLL